MSAAWTRKAGQNPRGGLNAKGRASYKAETGGTLKPPVKKGDNPRRASFLARMGNMAGPMEKTGSRHALRSPSAHGEPAAKRTPAPRPRPLAPATKGKTDGTDDATRTG